MDPHNIDSNTQVTPFMTSAGVANESIVGPPIGLVDIGDSADAYLFRVSLPGLRKNECKLRCEVLTDGIVNIRGEIVPDVGGLARDSTGGFQTKVQQHPSPGSFTLSFQLPGKADPRLFSPNYRADGILEGVVMKPKAPKGNSDGGAKRKAPSVNIDGGNPPPRPSVNIDGGNPPPPPPPPQAM